MACANVEIGQARMAFVNGEHAAQRCEHIAQLTWAHLQQLLERELQQLSANVEIDRLDIPPITVAFDTMNDETIARASAGEICRALLRML